VGLQCRTKGEEGIGGGGSLRRCQDSCRDGRAMTDAGAARTRDVEAPSRQILAAYRERTPRSAVEFSRAAKALAGGTTGNLRHFQPYPLYFRSASGARVTDIDGHTYIDCFLCNGPLLLGHRDPEIMAAIAEYAELGSMVVNPPLATDLAYAIREALPFAERLRFLNSGTEAVLTAVRLARAFTGREKIVKFIGHYHGQDDQFLIGLDPNAAPFGAGIPTNAYAASVLLRYGDLKALEQVLAVGDVAAVILDPAMHSGGLWGSSPEYLAAARTLTSAHGSVLIFDEVITGFRLALGGAQAYYGVRPDIATYAKALAAGEKLAAVAGREDILRSLDPNRPGRVRAVFQSGTGNDGTVGLAAGLAAITRYRQRALDGGYDALFARSKALADGLRNAFTRHDVPGHVNQLGPMLQLFLADVTATFESCARIPAGPGVLFYLALINEGILLSLPTSNHIYLSFVHTDADIAEILEKVELVLDRYDFGAMVRAETSAA
jgi:glutamate-1-semialdehyde 2,1-aminomutase